MKTLEEWKQLYEQKAGEAFQQEEGFRLFFLPPTFARDRTSFVGYISADVHKRLEHSHVPSLEHD